MFDNNNKPERPHAEPQIIPPDRGARDDWRHSPWRDDAFMHMHGTQRIYVTRLGPFGLALLMLAFAAVAAIVLILVLGTMLFWIPVVAVLVLGAALVRALRR